jgi:hypothetical protein
LTAGGAVDEFVGGLGPDEGLAALVPAVNSDVTSATSSPNSNATIAAHVGRELPCLVACDNRSVTTPAWLTLVVGLLGFTGVLIIQLLSNRRDDLRWRREREREQQVWAREDAARSYEYRREA